VSAPLLREEFVEWDAAADVGERGIVSLGERNLLDHLIIGFYLVELAFGVDALLLLRPIQN